MEPVEWGIVSAPIAALTAVAGYLAVKVISHGEKLANLLAHKEDTKARFDRQDETLDRLDRKLDLVLSRMNVRPTPDNSR